MTLLAPAKARSADANGTGCALASAIAARIAAGDGIVPAAIEAKALLDLMAAGGFPSAEGRLSLYW